jgi:hypothetical protein
VKKQTHKLKSLGDVAGIVAASPTLTAAARRLGVNRSSLHRWIVSGKVPRPGRRRSLAVNATNGPQPSELQTPEAWAEAVREAYELTGTELVVLDLAVRALEMARDNTQKGELPLAAMARFQQLVRQLDLEVESDGKAETPADVRPWPRQVG